MENLVLRRNFCGFHAFITLLFLTFSLNLAKADNFYWVGGQGSWNDYTNHWATNSGGNIFRSRVPSPNDTVIFDSLSFVNVHDTVWCDSVILTCYTMRWKNQWLQPIFKTLASSNSNIIKIYGSLELDSNMIWQYEGRIYFESTNSGNKIFTQGKHLPIVAFRGVTGQWTLQDSLLADSIWFKAGAFYSNNCPINTLSFRAVNNNTAQIYLSQSVVFTTHFSMHHNPLTLDANSCTIIMNNNLNYNQFAIDNESLYYLAAFIFDGGNNTFGRVVLNGYYFIRDINYFKKMESNYGLCFWNNNTIDTLIVNGVGQIIKIKSGSTIQVNDSVLFNGNCDTLNYIAAYPEGGSANFFKNNLPAYLNGIVIDNINSNNNINCNYGIALANSTGWLLNNSPATRTLYWVGGSGNWNDPQHWALTSGGLPGNCSPTPLDDVIFDNQSIAGNDTISQTQYISFCNSFSFNNTGFNPVFQTNGALKVWGSLSLQQNLTFNTNVICMRSDNLGNTINTAGHTLSSIVFNGNGSWQLQNSINLTHYFKTWRGSLTSNGFSINSETFETNWNWNKNVDIANSALSTVAWHVESAGILSLNTTASNIIMNGIFFHSIGHTYNNVTFSNSATFWGCDNNQFNNVTINGWAEITGNNFFGNLTCNSSNNSIRLQSGTTQTIINTLNITGTCGSPILLESSTNGASAFIAKSSGSVTINYVILQDITAGGGASFTANLCVASNNVSGWNVIPIPNNNMYWINGNGNWNDSSHWSYTSGGTPNIPGCVPWPVNDVFFDANSFGISSQVVTLSVPQNFCNSMSWNNVNNPIFSTSHTTNNLNVFGNVTLDSNMNNGYYKLILRSNQTNNTITSKNNSFGFVKFYGIGGKWDLTDAMQCDSIWLRNGTFKTAGKNVTLNVFRNDTSNVRALLLDSSTITARYYKNINLNGSAIDADSANIVMTGRTFLGGNVRYKNLTGVNDVTIHSSDTFQILKLSRIDTVWQDVVTDSLVLNNAGKQLSIGSGKTITINKNISTNANSGATVALECLQQGGVAYFKKLQDTVCLNYLDIRDVDTLGSAVFFAGPNSTKLGNANGWITQSCNPTYGNVWPGDANYDTIANNFDILNIGIAYGETGFVRNNASLTWVGQPSRDWQRVFSDTTDIKHADCDGNSIVDMNDTVAVSVNYNNWHPANQKMSNTQSNTGIPIYIDMPFQQVLPGQTFTIPVKLGMANYPANNVYGIAFTVTYQSNVIAPGSMSFSFANSWIISGNTGFGFAKNFFSQNEADFAITRINHINVSDTGEIASITLTIDPNASGSLKMTIKDILLIDKDQNILEVIPLSGSVIILGISEYGNYNAFNVYPNPSSGVFTIDAELSNFTVTVFDALGNAVYQSANEKTIDLSNVAKGIYMLSVASDNQNYSQRVLIE